MRNSSPIDAPGAPERARILVVEDDPAQAQLCLALAQSIGLVPAGTAISAESALGLAAHADIILTDYQLGGTGTGFDVLREVRARNLPVKVILMTAHGSERLAAEALRLGADDYLIKDTGFTEFLPQVLRRVAHLRHVEQALTAAQQQVVRAERRAAIGELTVAISHEMNNPLMALRAQLELLKLDAGKLPAEVQQNIHGAIAQVDRISAVVKRVADHARTAGTVEYVGGTKMTDLS